MVSESVAQGASLPRGVGACIHTLPESVVSLIPWRPRCSEEAAVPLGRPQSRKRCSDARDVCCTRQQTGEFCADPFVSIPAVRQLSAGKSAGPSASSSGSPRGGRTVEDFESNGCARRAREAGRRRRCIAGCAELRAGEATYARGRKCENALELRGRAPADSPDRAMNGALRAAGAREVGLCPDEIEHTGQQETALWARWGAHRERVDADA